MENSSKKILYITPHLSTGGCPKYLQLKIEYFLPLHQIWVVEWNDITGEAFVVQKKRIRDLIGDKLITLYEDKSKIFEIINEIGPDIIHFEEIAESFIPYSILKKIWSPDRTYNILETTHSSLSSIKDVCFLPDKWVFPSEFNKEKFDTRNGPEIVIWEAPIVDKQIINKRQAQEALGIRGDLIHILHVGLFTPGKNQGELIEMAKKFLEKPIQFHFVGNLAGNFEFYWKELVDNLPENCRVWGERDDVELFYEACHLFYFPSTYELNPLSVKEALSWKLPVFLRRLDTYGGKYDDNPLITYLSLDIENNFQKLENKINFLSR
ncbi:glycosyltransferase [bacterium]|nr:glycosyltransferase [Candidatus Elulimicrobium humile]